MTVGSSLREFGNAVTLDEDLVNGITNTSVSGLSGATDASKSAGKDYHTESLRYNQPKDKRKRWEDVDGNEIWPKSRILIARWTESQAFESLMGAIIVFNLGVIIYETDMQAMCYTPDMPDFHSIDTCEMQTANNGTLTLINMILLVIYTIEAVARGYVDRSKYFRNNWNTLDCLVVLIGWLSETFKGIPSISFLRFLRTMRLLRMLRIFISIRELYLLVSGMMSAFKTLFFSTVMLLGMLTIWSIILVEYVHPVNVRVQEPYEGCERCHRAFRSVLDSNLTLFQQIVAGDSWGAVSVPAIEESPLVGVILGAIVISVSLGLMNLVLAVIVERAQDAREQDREAKLKEKEAEQEQQKEELYMFCKAMDSDKSGQLDLQELLQGFDNNQAFRRLLMLMDIAKDELSSVFKLLDKDCSGEVSYDEFCEELHKIRTRDTRTMLTFLKLSVNDIHDKVSNCASKSDLVEQRAKFDEQLEVLKDIQSRLQASGKNMVGGRPSIVGADGEQRPSQMEAFSIDGDLSKALVEALGKDARQLASMKNGIMARLDAQVETLLHHSDWLGQLGLSVSAQESSKFQGVEDKMSRLRDNLYDAERQLEGSAAALARNSELLSGMSKEMDYQPKAGQKRTLQGLGSASPRIGQAPNKLVPKTGDQYDSRPGGRRRPSVDASPLDMLQRCGNIERPPPSRS